MKNIICFAITLSSLVTTTYSQRDITLKSSEKEFSLGFNMGVNQSLFQTSIPDVNIKNTFGFKVGVFGNYQLNPIFSISPKLEFSANNFEVQFADELIPNKENYSLLFISSDIAVHAMFTSKNKSKKPFFSFGPNVKLPWSSSNTSFSGRYSLSMDVSVGFKQELEFFNLIPELRYSHGLTDFNLNSDIESMKLHSISLLLNFN